MSRDNATESAGRPNDELTNLLQKLIYIIQNPSNNIPYNTHNPQEALNQHSQLMYDVFMALDMYRQNRISESRSQNAQEHIQSLAKQIKEKLEVLSELNSNDQQENSRDIDGINNIMRELVEALNPQHGELNTEENNNDNIDTIILALLLVLSIAMVVYFGPTPLNLMIAAQIMTVALPHFKDMWNQYSQNSKTKKSQPFDPKSVEALLQRIETVDKPLYNIITTSLKHSTTEEGLKKIKDYSVMKKNISILGNHEALFNADNEAINNIIEQNTEGKAQLRKNLNDIKNEVFPQKLDTPQEISEGSIGGILEFGKKELERQKKCINHFRQRCSQTLHLQGGKVIAQKCAQEYSEYIDKKYGSLLKNIHKHARSALTPEDIKNEKIPAKLETRTRSRSI